MENARIAIVEDNDDLRILTELYLQKNGHDVTKTATNLSEARQLVDDLDGDEVDIAIVDGDLGNGPGDGVEVVALLQARHPGVVTVGNSNRGEVPGATHNACKNPKVLIGIIDRL